MIRDAGAILLDMNPDRGSAGEAPQTVEGDQLADLRLRGMGRGASRPYHRAVCMNRRSAASHLAKPSFSK